MKDVLATLLRVLTLRIRPEDVERFDRRHLAFGLVATWIVGMGRWWDDPRANVLQHLGLGSVVYVFGLALILWILAKPLHPRFTSCRTLLTYITLTAPPAMLYALPVERWYGLAVARDLNVKFLATVAAWRVAMYFAWLVRAQGLRWWIAAIASLLPLTLIVAALTLLNLERAVFDLMGGLRDDGTPHDSAYATLVAITATSVPLLPVLLIGYGIATGIRGRQRERARNPVRDDP